MPFPTPPPTYAPTITISDDSSDNSKGEVIDLPKEVHCIIDHMFHHAHPYCHTCSSLPAATPPTRRDRCVTCSQAHQAPVAQDLLAIAEIASHLPPEYRSITLRDAHNLAHGITSTMR